MSDRFCECGVVLSKGRKVCDACNKKKAMVYQKNWRLKNPEKAKASARKCAMAWYYSHKEEAADYYKRHYYANKEKHIEWSMKWQKNNPGKMKAARLRRKFRDKLRVNDLLDNNESFLEFLWEC